MCGDPHGWMCDMCFGRLVRKDKLNDCITDEDLCEECKKVASKMCFCCDTLTDEELEDNLCIDCKVMNESPPEDE